MRQITHPPTIDYNLHILRVAFHKNGLRILSTKKLCYFPGWLYDAPQTILRILSRIDELTKGGYTWMIVAEKVS
jgi:hypothetical protein